MNDITNDQQPRDLVPWCLAGCALLVGIAAAYLYGTQVPRYARVYSDLGVTLPALTSFILALSSTGALILAIAPGVIGDVMVAIQPRGAGRTAAAALALVVALVVLGLFHLGLRMPMAEIAEQLDLDPSTITLEQLESMIKDLKAEGG